MTDEQRPLPTWILVVSGFFAFLELMVSFLLILSPESVAENVDLTAKGVDYLFAMWAARQFALGVIFAFAVWKRSAPMLTLAYLFFAVMFLGDLVIGISQREIPMILSAVVMCSLSVAMMWRLKKHR